MKLMTIFEGIQDQQKIKGTRIYRTTFEYRGSEYRLSSYLLVYTLTDGREIIANVDKEEANAVSGTGVSGVVAPISDIKILDRETSFGEDFVRDREAANKHRVDMESNQQKVKWIRSLMAMKPDGTMTPEFYDRIANNNFMATLKLGAHSQVPWKP
jgi:hypothetical protein